MTIAEGVNRHLRAPVTEVSTALLNVSEIVKERHAEVFHPDGSYIQDLETQEIINLDEGRACTCSKPGSTVKV